MFKIDSPDMVIGLDKIAKNNEEKEEKRRRPVQRRGTPNKRIYRDKEKMQRGRI